MSRLHGPEWAERQKKVNRIIEALNKEFGDEVQDLGDDLWLAMQMLPGPAESSFVIQRCQVN